MPKLTDKLIREAVEEFDKIVPGKPFGMIDTEKIDYDLYCELINLLETKIRQAVEEVKERLTVEKKVIPISGSQSFYLGYDSAVKDLEDLKKSI